jgi:hypothetical protein
MIEEIVNQGWDTDDGIGPDYKCCIMAWLMSRG